MYDEFDPPIQMDDIAERVEAYTQLLVATNKIRDTALKAEAKKMLDTVRRSIYIPPKGELHVLPNQKPVANTNTKYNRDDTHVKGSVARYSNRHSEPFLLMLEVSMVGAEIFIGVALQAVVYLCEESPDIGRCNAHNAIQTYRLPELTNVPFKCILDGYEKFSEVVIKYPDMKSVVYDSKTNSIREISWSWTVACEKTHNIPGGSNEP
jgi:hypothetical protein